MEKWSLENIRKGFDKFFAMHGRYPAAYDIDDFDFLPSSRQIQRKFGGLIKLRKILELDIKSYSEGSERSKKAIRINARGKEYENKVLDLLKESFDEKFIHIEKPVSRNSKNRYDFFIYAKPKNFAIDVFCTNDERGVVNIMNIKENKYRKSESYCDLFFVYFGNANKSKVINWQRKRKIGLPENWKVVAFDDFKECLHEFDSFKAI